MPSSIQHAVLMCHAPIVIPEVAGARRTRCEATTAAMTAAAQQLNSWGADVLVVLSPHSPRDPRGFTVVGGSTLIGSFSAFGAPQARFELPAALDARQAISAAMADVGLRQLTEVDSTPLDHGAAVPVYFASQAGWRGQTVVIGFPWHLSAAASEAMGRALSLAAQHSKGRWCLLASGDMSHRLQPDSPSGYHPRAAEFDSWVSERVALGDYQGALNVDGRLRHLAAEDVLDSLRIANAAIDDSQGHRRLSYEGPFGVGYLVAILRDAEAPHG